MKELQTYPLSGVTPDKTIMEFCCTTVAPILRYLQEHFGEEAAREVVYRSQMNWDYLQNRQHWISYDYFCSLMRLAVERADDEMVPYKAGLEYTDPSSLSFMAVCISRALSVRQAYGLVAQWGQFWSKIHEAEILEASANHIVFRNSYPHHKQQAVNCLAVRGSLAAVPIHWGLMPATVRDVECCCKGDAFCTYHISWEEAPRSRPPLVGFLVGAFGGGAMVVAVGASWPTVLAASLLAAVGFLGGKVFQNELAIRKLIRDTQVQADSLLDALRRMEDFNRDLQGTVEGRTAELSKANAQLEETLRELHESQEQVVVKERDAAIGVLAAGMAHELNSPINAIRLSMQALLEDIGPEDPARRLLLASERATSRCRRMVNDLLCFARDKRMRMVGDIRESVVQAVETFRNETEDACPVDVSIEADLAPLTVDRAQIQQALSNLLVNAHDAMEGKGRIRVTMGRDVDGGVILVVADTGPGMADAMRARGHPERVQALHGMAFIC